MDNSIIPAIIYKDKGLDYSNKNLLNDVLMVESSLNYFYATNAMDSNYYQSFINFYYKKFNSNSKEAFNAQNIKPLYIQTPPVFSKN